MGNSQDKVEAPAAARPSAFTVDEESPFVKRILEARKELTGVERVKLMFTKDEFGTVSPEIQRIVHTMLFSAVVGGIIGAVGRGRIAHMNFIKSNVHEIFQSPLEAKRKLQDTVTLGMGAGAFRIGWRVTLFTTIYMGVSTVASTYRGKMGVVDQVLGAGAAGFVYKLPQGPKAQMAGTLVGSMLGLTAGIITLGITKLTGETIDSVNLRYYQIIAKKQQEELATTKAAKEKLREVDRPIMVGHTTERLEYDSLAKFHDELITALEEERNENKEMADDQATGKSNATQQESSTNQSNNPATNKIVHASKSASNNENSSKSSTRQIASTTSG